MWQSVQTATTTEPTKAAASSSFSATKAMRKHLLMESCPPWTCLLWALTGCGGAAAPDLDAPPTELAPLTLATSGDRSLPIRLSAQLEQARIQLPESNLPQGAGLPGQLPLTEGWTAHTGKAKKGFQLWTHKLPVRIEGKNHVRAPEGVQILVNDTPLGFTNLPSATRSKGWDIHNGELLLVSKTNPGTSAHPPVLQMQNEGKQQTRLNWKLSGLTDTEFIPYELTDDAITRTGLLLPAPGKISWTVDLPQEPVLELHSAMVPRSVATGPQSDGARLKITVNDEEVLDIGVQAGGGFKAHRIDLKAYSGKTIRLAMESTSGESADFDHVFVGEPLIWGQPTQTPRRVIVVGIDTLRFDSVTQHGYARDTTAGLQDIADRALIFDNATTPAPRTRPSFRTVLTGRQPLPAIRAEGIAQVLRKVGFTTAGVTANVHLVPRFGFNRGFDYWHFENSVNADVEISRAKEWLDDNKDRDSFLFLHLMDPHNFYRAPGSYKNKYTTGKPKTLEINMNRWKVGSLDRAGKVSESDKVWFQDRYDGEVAYMADQLGAFLAWVYSLPGETLVVLQSDHGEEFWEHGGYEHNHTLYQEVVQGLLWIIPPAGFGGSSRHVGAPTGLVDIVPTILDALGVAEALRPPTDGISLAPLLDGSRTEEAAALLHTLNARRMPIGHLMYDKERWAVQADGHKYIVQTFSGKDELYDLKADPQEQKNLIQQQSPVQMAHWHQALSEATGWPAGAGWHVQLLSGKSSFELHFSKPVNAMAMDPETAKTRRANIEWGESSPFGPDDVALLHFNEDKTRLHVKPGKARKGQIAIIAPPDTTVTLVAEGQSGILAGQRLVVGPTALKFTPGSVILPQDSIRNYVGLSKEKGAASAEDLSALQALGYVQ
jgi:arylsulfatase A-like enzyme